jgi:hypothetical protein
LVRANGHADQIIATTRPSARDQSLETRRQVWQRFALKHYEQAFERTIEPARRQVRATKFGPGVQSIATEAGRASLRLAANLRGQKPPPKRRSVIRDGLAALEDAAPRAISSIVFRLDGAETPRAMVDPGISVSFDLNGDGRPGRWPWVKSGTAFLIWDPEAKGGVESGRRLLGSVSWWIFWRSGFQALGALDDNGDGWLGAFLLIGALGLGVVGISLSLIQQRMVQIPLAQVVFETIVVVQQQAVVVFLIGLLVLLISTRRLLGSSTPAAKGD